MIKPAADLAEPSQRALLGIACLCVGILCFSIQDALVKHLVGVYSVLQILMLRSVTAGSLLALIIAVRSGITGFHTRHPRLHALRCSLVFIAFVSFYTAVSRLPLAEVVAIFSAAPIIITALSGPVLGERVDAHRWCAVVVGFLGVLIMLRPGSSVFEPVALLALLAAFAYAGSAITARRLGGTERALLIGLLSNLTFVVGCGTGLLLVGLLSEAALDPSQTPALLRHFRWPPPEELTLMLVAGLVTLTGFVLVPRAYQLAPVSAVSPFEYTYLLWAMLFGYVIFNEVPRLSTLAGALLVICAGIYVLRREAKMKARG